MTGAATRAEIPTGAASAPASMQHPSASMEKPMGRPLPYGAGAFSRFLLSFKGVSLWVGISNAGTSMRGMMPAQQIAARTIIFARSTSSSVGLPRGNASVSRQEIRSVCELARYQATSLKASRKCPELHPHVLQDATPKMGLKILKAQHNRIARAQLPFQRTYTVLCQALNFPFCRVGFATVSNQLAEQQREIVLQHDQLQLSFRLVHKIAVRVVDGFTHGSSRRSVRNRAPAAPKSLQRGRNVPRATLGQGGMHPSIERQNSKHAPNGYFISAALIALAIVALFLLMIALSAVMIASLLVGATLFLRECVRHLERILGISRGMRS